MSSTIPAVGLPGGRGGSGGMNSILQVEYDVHACVQELAPSPGAWRTCEIAGYPGDFDLLVHGVQCNMIRVSPDRLVSPTSSSSPLDCVVNLKGQGGGPVDHVYLTIPPVPATVTIQRYGDTKFKADRSEVVVSVSASAGGGFVHQLTFNSLPALENCCPGYAFQSLNGSSAFCGLPAGYVTYSKPFAVGSDGKIHVPGIPCVSDPLTFVPPPPPTASPSLSAVSSSSSSPPSLSAGGLTIDVATAGPTVTPLSVGGEVAIYVVIFGVFFIFVIAFILIEYFKRNANPAKSKRP